MYLGTQTKSIKTRKKSFNLKNTPVFRTHRGIKKVYFGNWNVFQLCHFTRVKISSTNSKILLHVPRIYKADLAFRRNNADQSVLANFYFESRVLKIVESKNNDQQSERKTERTKCLAREAEGGNTLTPSPVYLD